ncbi:hypothetical protein GLOIN_2v1782174 [Rhizophagus irregularis DAOM 181602=DAOM 197198]|nr:hypothetical protein GLOIN_2v1782174 [Rhizophagus irregularis DAOM 181602=DAOM 197198]
MGVINISIKKGQKQIYGWMIHPFSVTDKRTIEQFYNDLPLGVLSEENQELEVKVFLGDNIRDISNGVALNCPIADATKSFGECIELRLQDIPTIQPSAGKNAFNILLQESSQLYLPNMKENGNEKECMKFNFVNYLQENNAGWVGKDTAESLGREFIKHITEAIWYIDMCGVKKFKDRGYSIPTSPSIFFEHANPAKYKKKRPDFEKKVLNGHISNLITYKEAKWFNKSSFNWFKKTFIEFLDSLISYVLYLDNQARVMNENHALDKPVRSIADSGTTTIYNANKFRSGDIIKKYEPLVDALQKLEDWVPLDISPYCLDNPTKRYVYLNGFEKAFPFKVGHYSFNSGNNSFNVTWVWKVNICVSESERMNESQKLTSGLEELVPQYLSRKQKYAFINSAETLFGANTVKKSILRNIYKTLTQDSTAANCENKAEIDARVVRALHLGDPNIVIDLRELNLGRPEKYNVFWEYCQKFLVAKAISVKDLRIQVAAICPDDTPIPHKQWIHLQFWPKNPQNNTSLQYTGRLQVKFMVQIRQLRIEHEDALFRYLKELAVILSGFSWLVFLDDKHRCKVGEPGFPVAAVDRGRSVLVSQEESFVVADHDFTKTGLIPSVTMLCDIPSDMEGSFYRGQVNIGLKDPIFESSTPMRHAELYDILINSQQGHHYLLVYTDGGSDHQLRFLRVQLSWICLFLALDLDYFVAVRTPPGHSWKNPVERIMSILNLGLQSVGLMRQEMGQEFEHLIEGCNTMEAICEAAIKEPRLKKELKQSLQPTIGLVNTIFQRQSLKDEPLCRNLLILKNMVKIFLKYD